tara:strand:+ start:119 stop:886 length:768 start_codon:yes stop_codon:yes gene_type:complete
LYSFFSSFLNPLLNSTNLLIFLSIFLFFLNLKNKKNYITYSKYIVLFLFLSISFLPVGSIGLNYLEKNYIKQQEIIDFDNIIVLGGTENISATIHTKKLNFYGGSERLISSIKLALIEPDSTIFFLGGNQGLLKEDKIDESYVAKLFYTDVGFDLSRIVFINNTNNTKENLFAFKKFNDEDKAAVLITSAFHMKRSMLIAEELDLDLIPYAVNFKSITGFNLIDNFQKFNINRNLSFFDLFFKEILGILAFKIFN